MNKKIICIIIGICFLFVGFICLCNENKYGEAIFTSSTALSNTKIGWGIKRNDNHMQPDLGSKNKELMDKYDGISMGNKNKKYVYLTFDEGYEAGYTEKILDVLKENDITATFFLTAHYINTNADLVQKMIDNGHIIGNHAPRYLMSGVVA